MEYIPTTVQAWFVRLIWADRVSVLRWYPLFVHRVPNALRAFEMWSPLSDTEISEIRALWASGGLFTPPIFDGGKKCAAGSRSRRRGA